MARRPRKSGPSGAALLRQVAQQAGAGWPPGLTLLTGDDLYHLDRAQRLLLDTLVPGDASDFALTVYADQRVDLSTVVSAARSVGMFAPSRVVLVRDIRALEGDVEALAAYAADPPRASYLLVRAPELDQRRKLHKTLATAGRALCFNASEDVGELLGDVTSIAAEKGLKLERQAAAFLAEACGADFYRIDSELEKIVTWLGRDGGGGKVGLDVVRKISAGSALLSGWEVADAVLLRDRNAALASLRSLIDSGDEPIRLVGGLAWRARTMLQAKSMLEQGVAPRQVVQAVRAWAYERNLMTGLSRYSLEDLLGFPGLLLEADRTLKSRALDPRAVLSTLVSRMTAPPTESR